MKNAMPINEYSVVEERVNVISHAIGFFLSIVALHCMLSRSFDYPGYRDTFCVAVFGVSLVLLYAASTCYHLSRRSSLRRILNVVDHAAIYVLISGTYTPFTLITLRGTTGLTIFVVSWTMALIGIVLKLFFTGKYNFLSTTMYVLMGWIIVFAIKQLFENLSFLGVFWLFAGGLSYTIGAILYGFDKINLNHAIFHLFVLLGSFCHFISVYFYVL
jgi:hemolysin III